MSTGVLTPAAACPADLAASFYGKSTCDDVVEIGLLLPAEWAVALLELSKKRQESMGQVLRSLIGRALTENNATV